MVATLATNFNYLDCCVYDWWEVLEYKRKKTKIWSEKAICQVANQVQVDPVIKHHILSNYCISLDDWLKEWINWMQYIFLFCLFDAV